jgi:hypothetical protein
MSVPVPGFINHSSHFDRLCTRASSRLRKDEMVKGEGKKSRSVNEIVTREYTVNLHKRLLGK